MFETHVIYVFLNITVVNPVLVMQPMTHNPHDYRSVI